MLTAFPQWYFKQEFLKYSVKIIQNGCIIRYSYFMRDLCNNYNLYPSLQECATFSIAGAWWIWPCGDSHWYNMLPCSKKAKVSTIRFCVLSFFQLINMEKQHFNIFHFYGLIYSKFQLQFMQAPAWSLKVGQAQMYSGKLTSTRSVVCSVGW